MSADGRHVAYETLASNLAANDANNVSDVFVYDRLSGTNMLVSAATNGASGNGSSRNPIISGDGRFVAFLSDAKNLFATSASSPSQLFVRDLANNETFLVSVDSQAVRNQIGSSGQVLNLDARSLVYTGGTNVYLFDLIARTNLLIHPGAFNPSISASGRFIALEKSLYGPQAPVPWTNSAIVIWDTQLQAETLASANMGNTATGSGFSRAPFISPDGRYVLFKSLADDLVPDDVNRVTDIFVRDVVLGQTLLLSFNRTGITSANLLSGNPVMSADGRTVLFESFSTDLGANDFNRTKDIFVLRLSAEDSDQDGMDDDWEMAFFGSLSRDGTGDFDQDGVVDVAEFKAGTNPTNKAAILRAISVASIFGGTATVFWSSVPGRTYQVQYKDDLAENGWNQLPETVIATGSTASQLDDTAGTNNRRFYRVMLVAP